MGTFFGTTTPCTPPCKRLSRYIGLSITLGITSLALSGCVFDPKDAVPRAVCGPGSNPETGMQGQIPLADRKSGRSTQGYSCNMKRVGHYQGTGNATMGASHEHCMYAGSMGLGYFKNPNPGVQVVSFEDINNPVLTTVLNSPATRLGTWETLKVHPERGLLIAASVPLIFGGGFLSVYDIGSDCSQPRQLNAVDHANNTFLKPFLAHEGGFSPDGNTYWTAALVPGIIYAFDITNPSEPTLIFSGRTGSDNHGFNFSPDGTRLYIANQFPAGFNIFDVSDIQNRKKNPIIRSVGKVRWYDGLLTQIPVPFVSKGRKYIMAVDEGGSGGVRLVDINDETKPFVVRKYELEINRPQYRDIRTEETEFAGIFGYESHYCSVDRYEDPQYLACSYVQSGIRVFDISDPLTPKEIAYYYPPTEPGAHKRLYNSAHSQSPFASTYTDFANGNVAKLKIELGPPDMTADWCMSKPRFVGNQIWVHCDDAGAMVLEFTNSVAPQAQAQSQVGDNS